MKKLKKFLHRLQGTATGGAIVIAGFSVMSKILGLIRDRLLASGFGAGDILDAYYAAFKLPDLIFNTLVLGALSSAFIPVFVGLKQKFNNQNSNDNYENTINQQNFDKTADQGLDHWQLATAVMNTIFVVMIVLGLLIFIFAPILVPLIAPGFAPEKLELTIQMTKIMLFSILFFGISNVLSGVLQAMKQFVIYALAPIMYNLGIIFGILFLVRRMGPIGLAWGVVLGAGLHFLVQLPLVIKLGWKWQPFWGWKEKMVKKVGLLMLPRAFGLAVNQVNLVLVTVIASTLMAGSVAIFNLAFNIMSVPISVFAVSFAVASFPVLSEHASAVTREKFVDYLVKIARRILYLIIPVSLFMIALRAQTIRLILGAGAFDWQDTVLTADSLGFFALSLFAQGLTPLLARAFFALHDTKTPVIISLLSVVVNISGALIAVPIMGVIGLALAFSIASIIQVALLYAALHHKVGSLREKEFFNSIFRISVAAIGAVFFLQVAKYAIANVIDMQTFIGVLVQFLVSGFVGALVYIAMSVGLGCSELVTKN